MEVHTPVKPIESAKDFLIHLSMVTIGILIALGLEQAVEAWHHHELGVQARENILSEIRDNKREIDNERVLNKQNKQKIERTLATLRQFLAHKKLSQAELNISINGADLNSTSWSTAGATGAVAYMGYAEAKKFAKAYSMQELVQRTQNDEFRAVSGALSLVSYSPAGPGSMSDDLLRGAEREVLNCLALLDLWDQIASQLSEEYGRVLKGE